MSEKVYTIKESTLVGLNDKVRELTGLPNDETKTKLSLSESLDLLNDAAVNRVNYINFLKQGEGSILFIPKEIEEIPSNYLKTYFSWVEQIKWDKPRGDLVIKGSAFAGSKLTSIEIPEEVISIGNYLFQSSSNLTKVLWNTSKLNSIPAYTFEYCLKLEEVIFCKEAYLNITSIGDSAFQPSTSSYGKLKLNLNAFKNLTTIENSAFYRSKLTLVNDNGETEARLIIPETLTKLTNFCFGFTNIQEVFFPKTFQNFGGHDFDTAPVTKIEFEEGIGNIKIGDATFMRCPLVEIVNSDCINAIGNSSFYSADLTVTNEFKNVEEIDYQSFAYVDTTQLSLPKLKKYRVITKDAQPFYKAEVQTLTFGTDLGKEISTEANYYNELTPTFFSNSNINTIKFLGTIEDWCSRVITSTDTDWPLCKTITNEDGTVSNGKLFVYNTNNELVEFTGTSDAPFEIDVETINANVFSDYKNFRYVKFSSNLKHIKENAFKNIKTVANTDEIHFDIYPYQLLDLTFENEYSSPYGENTIASTVRCNDPTINTTNKIGVSTLTDSRLKHVSEETGEYVYLTTIKIPAYLFAFSLQAALNVGAATYYPNNELEEVIIETKAYYNCARMTILRFGTAQKVVIEDQAFYNATVPTYMTGIHGSTHPNITNIGTEAFYNCTALKYSKSSSENFVLPIIKTIGNRAFYGCTGLIEVTLGSEGNPVESIGIDAFSGCTGITKLTVYYDSTIYTAETFTEMANYPWGLGDTVAIEGIDAASTTEEV